MPQRDGGRRGFYLGTAILCCAIAMAGFIPAYYGPVLLGATAFPIRLHLHAAVATLWLLLLIAQTGLISGGRRRLHMRLGVATLGVAVVFVPLTLWAIAGMVTRRNPPGELELTVFFPQVASLLLFVGLVTAGYVNRRRAEGHKRFMIMATVALLGTPVARIDFWGINQHPLLLLGLWNLPALILVFNDLWTRRRVHWITGLGLSLLLALQVASVTLAGNAAWRGVVIRIAEFLRPG